MKSRILPKEEWGKLDVTGLPQIGPTMDPADVQVVVVEEDGKVVATMGLFRAVHLEGLWIDEDHKGKAGTVRALLRETFDAGRRFGAEWMWGTSETSRMASILEKMNGIEIPAKSFIIPVGGR